MFSTSAVPMIAFSELQILLVKIEKTNYCVWSNSNIYNRKQ